MWYVYGFKATTEYYIFSIKIKFGYRIFEIIEKQFTPHSARKDESIYYSKIESLMNTFKISLEMETMKQLCSSNTTTIVCNVFCFKILFMLIWKPSRLIKFPHYGFGWPTEITRPTTVDFRQSWAVKAWSISCCKVLFKSWKSNTCE